MVREENEAKIKMEKRNKLLKDIEEQRLENLKEEKKIEKTKTR